MFARKITMQLKPYACADFTRTMENEILPLLSKQKGFVDELCFRLPGGTEVFAISLWEKKEDAEYYNREVYPKVFSFFEKWIEKPPTVETYEVLNSTFHKYFARLAA